MKKSTGGILVVIIILLLGIIIIGDYVFVKGNNDANKEIKELKSEIANLEKNIKRTNNNSNTQINGTPSATTQESNQSAITMKDVAGEYECETKNSTGETWGITLDLLEDGTFGYGSEYGNTTGNYFINGDKIVLNVIFNNGTGTGLNIVKRQEILTVKSDGSLETKDLHTPNSPETITFKKVSDINSDYDIRDIIKGAIGSGPDYYFTYDY